MLAGGVSYQQVGEVVVQVAGAGPVGAQPVGAGAFQARDVPGAVAGVLLVRPAVLVDLVGTRVGDAAGGEGGVGGGDVGDRVAGQAVPADDVGHGVAGFDEVEVLAPPGAARGWHA